jgi:CRISPR-associated endoribonuclease Cas6
MRIQINFQAESMPLHYRMGLLSLIKEALSRSDNEYFNKLFPSLDFSMKPFGYSVYLQKFSFQEDIILLKGFQVTISSSNYEFMLHLYNGVQKIEKYQYKNHVWHHGTVRMLKEHTIQSERVLFKTLSPVLIESKVGKPLHPDDKDYEKEFNYYANLVVGNLLERPLRRPIQVNTIGMKKVVVKESNQALMNSDGPIGELYFTAYKGHILLEGDTEDLMCLYQNAISRRRSLGFGLLEVEMEGVK